MSFFGFLRERLVLHECLTIQSFLFSNLPRYVEVVLHVRNDTTKACLFSDITHLSCISCDIFGCGYYFVIIGLVTVVLLYDLVILHVLERRLEQIRSDVLGGSECLVITDLNLPRSILFPDECQSGFLEGISDGRIRWFRE